MIGFENVDIDEMTAEIWRNLTKQERDAWWTAQQKKGNFSFRCSGCGFPDAYGTSKCEACSKK